MHEHFPFLIHLLGRFWRRWICMSRYWIYFISVIRCSMSSCMFEESGVSPYLILISYSFLFLFLYFL